MLYLCWARREGRTTFRKKAQEKQIWSNNMDSIRNSLRKKTILSHTKNESALCQQMLKVKLSISPRRTNVLPQNRSVPACKLSGAVHTPSDSQNTHVCAACVWWAGRQEECLMALYTGLLGDTWSNQRPGRRSAEVNPLLSRALSQD